MELVHFAVLVSEAAVETSEGYTVDGSKAFAIKIRLAVAAANTDQRVGKFSSFNRSFTIKSSWAVVVTA